MITEKGRVWEEYALSVTWAKHRYGSVRSLPIRLWLWVKWRRLDAVTVDIEPPVDLLPFRLPRKNLTPKEIADVWANAPYRTKGDDDVE